MSPIRLIKLIVHGDDIVGFCSGSGVSAALQRCGGSVPRGASSAAAGIQAH
jgi:hypothetical protein